MEEPAGLNEFLAQDTVPSDQSNEPEGLNDFIAPEIQKEKYSSIGQKALAATEGVAKGLLGPVATAAERGLSLAGVPGLSPEEQRAREEVNPVTHYGSEALGFIIPAFLTGGASAEARAVAEAPGLAAEAAKYTFPALAEAGGAKVAKAFGFGEEAGSTLAKIGATSTKAATEMAIYQSGNEISKMINDEPGQSFGTAVSHIGLSAALGAGGGLLLGSISPLWKAKVGDKVAQFGEDAKSRLAYHISNPDPAEAITTELTTYHKGIKSIADEVYGPEGLKAQDIAKLVPELPGAKFTEEALKPANLVQNALNKMAEDPLLYPPRLAKQLEKDLDIYIKQVATPGANSADLFDATQRLKQALQNYSQYDKFIKQVDEEYGFVKYSKDMAYTLRKSLEDPNIWGKAAERQLVINKAFTEYLPALEDFERKFTSEKAGERVIDPAKIKTYVDQLGNPKAELKKGMLEDYINASEKYKNVISQSHSNLGIESPIIPSSLNVTRSTFQDLPPGAQLVDAFIKKGLSDLSGKSIGGAFGALGAAALHLPPSWGALLGSHALGPFFSSVMPSLAKSILKTDTKAEALKATTDYGMAVFEGNRKLVKTAKNIFKNPAEAAATIKGPSDKDKENLNKLLEEAKENPKFTQNIGGNIAHYFPEHGAAAIATATAAIQYLNNLKPSDQKKNAFDGTTPPSPMKQAAYDRALSIAQDPNVILKHVAQGSLTSADVTTLRTIYPGLYQNMSNKLYEQMVDHINKGGTIPYPTRLSLSLFMAHPLDSTMTPEAIIAAQPLPKQMPQAPAFPKPKRGTASLSKLSNAYRTPGQAAALDKSSRE